MKRTKLVLLIMGMMATAAAGYWLASSNIDPAHKFSWNENSGWMNWLDADGGASGVVVASDHLSGYLWRENTGWMNVGDGAAPYANTNDTNYGVNILPGGDLDGFGWDENVGWVNFGWAASTANPDRARFDSGAGRFRGYAWGENDGWINLDDSTHFVAVEPVTVCTSPVVVSNIASRYIQIEPDASVTDPVAFHIECGVKDGDTVSNEGWVQLTHKDYDDGPQGLVNIGKTTPNCADADFLTPDEWTSGGVNALYVTGLAVCPSFAWDYECDDGSSCDHKEPNDCQGIGDESCDPIQPISRPTVTARCVDCAGPDAASVQPSDPTWVYCDSSGDGQTTFFADLFKQFSNTAAAGGPNFTGPDPGIEVDTQGNWKDVPDQQVTFFADIFQCFGATAAGGGDTWTGPTCP